MRAGWICDGCDKGTVCSPWNCPGCEKETCDNCFCRMGHCKACCTGKSDRQLAEAANKHGDFDFDPDGLSEIIGPAD